MTGEWHDIGSAPRDGRSLLCWSFGECVICWWVTGKNGEGWTTGWETVGGYDVGWSWVQPTHWMPLPHAPSPKRAEP